MGNNLRDRDRDGRLINAYTIQKLLLYTNGSDVTNLHSRFVLSDIFYVK